MIQRLSRPGDRGSTLLEFSLLAPIVIFLFMGILEFGRFFYTRLTLQHAVREAARFAITGRASTDPDTGDPMSRAESIRRVILEEASTLNLSVENVSIDPPDGGGPSQVVRVTGAFQYQFVTPGIGQLFPGSHYDFTVSTAMKNEPYR